MVRRELRSRNMLGRQGSDERLYIKREDGGRGLKSMRDVYKETRLRVTCYMAMAKSTNEWIKVAWKREMLKNENSMIDEAVAIIIIIIIIINSSNYYYYYYYCCCYHY